MIEQLYKLGLYVAKENEHLNDLLEVVENPNSNGKYNTIAKIVFVEKDSGEIYYKEIDLEEADKEKNLKYLYKRGSSNGPNFTPTALVTEIGKTLNNKIIKCLESSLKKFSAYKEKREYKELENIFSILKKEKDKILLELTEKTQRIKDGIILTITLIGVEEKFPGDFQLYRESLASSVEEKYFKKYGLKSLGENTSCFVCRKKREKVYGFCNTYNIYTVDKPGFVAGGFNQKDAWKNYPVCGSCAKILELGKRYLEENFSSRMGGINYFIVPNIIFNKHDDMQEVDEIYKQFEQNIKISLSKENRQKLTNAENDLSDLMSEQSNFLNFSLVFYEEKQNAFRLLLSVEDVLPSNIQEIFTAKKRVEKANIFHNIKVYNFKEKKTQKINLEVLFDDTIRNFFINNDLEGNFDKSFLEIVNAVFTRRIINYDFVIERILAKIRPKFAREEYIHLDVLKGFMFLKFLQEIKILSRLPKGGEKKFMEMANNIYEEKANLFFAEHTDFFQSDYLKAVFLTGVLVQKLLNLQAKEKNGNKPFYSRLNGLKFNDKLVRKIYIEAIDKLNQYDKNYYLKLEQLIAQYMLNTDKQLTDAEISFYFVLGMNLVNHFRTEAENQDDDLENSEEVI